jgi:plasmid stabilization system protein ParE
VATVVIARRARSDLARLIESHSLPGNTPKRVRVSLESLVAFPLLGTALTGRWRGFRVILGPWPWMLIIYAYEEAAKTVTVVAIHDARSASSAAAVG